MENQQHEPQPLLATSENPLDVVTDFDDDDDDATETTPSTRHDGWTGQRMAMFCALLAETGIVTQACHAVGMSTTSAYSARRRNPLFGAAWDEALSLARNRLADALLERSLTGCVEKYYRDGELVGEKRILDNRLGMAILRRLDRKAETGLALHSNVPQPQPVEETPDWDLMLSALRSGDEEMMAEAMIEVRKAEEPALSLSKGYEVGEVGDPPNRPPSGVDFDADEPDPRCWWDEEDDVWMTDFPPPPGFAGYEKGRWGDEEYSRECTAEESARLKAAYEAELAEERAEDEAERDEWFAALRHPEAVLEDCPAVRHPEAVLEDCPTVRHPGLEPGPALTSNSDARRQAPDQVRGDAEQEPGPALTSEAEDQIPDPPPDPATQDSPCE